jgi:hypothetical protein
MFETWTEKKIIWSHIKIWKILKYFIENKDFFKNTWINELCLFFKINKRTLKKYLKHWYKKAKKRNKKFIYISDTIELQYLKDINKIVNKYNWHIKKESIKLGQYYLNNLR